MSDAFANAGQWNNFFLALLLCLVAVNVFFVARRERGGQYPGLVVSIGLLLNHVAFVYTGLGWFGVAAKSFAGAWTVFMLYYVFSPYFRQELEGQR